MMHDDLLMENKLTQESTTVGTAPQVFRPPSQTSIAEFRPHLRTMLDLNLMWGIRVAQGRTRGGRM
jgi:hypothetical protein